MHITKLKLTGFKSFVESSELLVEPGLTGIVGPNGCGKSNLLEALRWVMGESSYKAMRGGAMEDVIFAGTKHRPKRNMAEVTMRVDNKTRTAPAEFNESDELDITRRIERDQGSSYFVNGKHARARDIKLLFEDAATGARSHALVRQGQIGEIVGAKPQARRRILEDAAGIAGLHSRRHESELRLNAAENNLERLSDVIGQLDNQLNSLKRQARQAERYKALSREIKALDALIHYLKWKQACDDVTTTEQTYQDILKLVATATKGEAKLILDNEALAQDIETLRLEEQKHAVILQRLSVEKDHVSKEESQLQARANELKDAISQAQQDQTREENRIETATKMIETLSNEEVKLKAESNDLSAKRQAAEVSRQEQQTTLDKLEDSYNQLTAQLSDERAARQTISQRLTDHEQREQRLTAMLTQVSEKQALMQDNTPLLEELAQLKEQLSSLKTQAVELDEQADQQSAKLNDIRKKEDELKGQLKTAELSQQTLATEILTLEKLLVPQSGQNGPIVLDEINAEPGYEKAVAATLGDDLEAALDENAPLHWRKLTNNGGLPSLPGKCRSLAQFVSCPPALDQRMQMTGLVENEDEGRTYQGALTAGQRLVSLKGSLWRWDGFYAASDAHTPAVRRLVERNRLTGLQGELSQAQSTASQLAEKVAKLTQTRRDLEANVNHIEQKRRDIRQAISTAQERRTHLQHEQQSSSEQRATLNESRNQLTLQLDELAKALLLITQEKAAFASLDQLQSQHETKRGALLQAREAYNEARLALSTLQTNEDARQARLTKISQELTHWQGQITQSNSHKGALDTRISRLQLEQETTDFSPEALLKKQQLILNQLSEHEQTHKKASDAFQKADNHYKASLKKAQEVQKELGTAREQLARVETRLETARGTIRQSALAIEDQFGGTPDECLAIAGFERLEDTPSLKEQDHKLQQLKLERERLGSVNLLAEDEMKTITDQFGSMIEERTDLEKAINKLRHGIGQLNGEGRTRLMAAFDEVNGHFSKLFTTLFGGGEARLELVESDDPLEAGLEIIARPPGKKPQVLTLLSGGEKALTAMALIFAVFLTNPSPICVLDEVDAPLDDANVDRFCTLLEEMKKNTDTRFLVITHHPMTMARMNRLFGVTMMEKGVSQLVSVDLSTAETLREAS